MQTFLPFPDYVESAQVLDYRRLGKQRVEAKQILNALENGGGWSNHPAVKMWRGYEFQLCLYAINVCQEWRRRGYKDSLLPFFIDKATEYADNNEEPWWLGLNAFHKSHRSNLLRKDAGYYSMHFDEPHDLPYIWPT